jgi:hypothetical protein
MTSERKIKVYVIADKKTGKYITRGEFMDLKHARKEYPSPDVTIMKLSEFFVKNKKGHIDSSNTTNS